MNTARPSAWRTCLIWCLAMLLPLQAWAAGAGLHCAGMANALARTTIDVQAPCHDSHPIHSPAPRSVEAASLVPGSAEHATTAAEASTAPMAAHDSPGCHHCSACAACGVNAPLPASGLPAPARAQADVQDPAVLLAWPQVLVRGLERPPRAARA